MTWFSFIWVWNFVSSWQSTVKYNQQNFIMWTNQTQRESNFLDLCERVRKNILCNWIMEQAMVAITPWEWLSADSQMFICNEFWTWLFSVFLMTQVSVQHAQTDSWETDEERQSSPQNNFSWKTIQSDNLINVLFNYRCVKESSSYPSHHTMELSKKVMFICYYASSENKMRFWNILLLWFGFQRFILY